MVAIALHKVRADNHEVEELVLVDTPFTVAPLDPPLPADPDPDDETTYADEEMEAMRVAGANAMIHLDGNEGYFVTETVATVRLKLGIVL